MKCICLVGSGGRDTCGIRGNVVEASLVSAQGAGVVLKEPDGTTLQIGKDSLSQADPDYFSGR